MKINKVKIVVISIIVLFLAIVFIVAYYSFKRKDYNILKSTGWVRLRDKYETTKDVEFPGDPLPNVSLLFYSDKIKVCNFSGEEMNAEDMFCDEHDYSWKEGEITVKVKEGKKKKKIVYTYFFNEDGELVLTYSGDGFEYRFYYARAMG